MEVMGDVQDEQHEENEQNLEVLENTGNEECLERLLNDSNEEIERCEREIVLETIKLINKNKKRASTKELTKRISGTSKEEVSRILDILLRQNVIEIRQQGTVKESIKILNYEPGKKGSYNNSQLGLQAIDGRLKKLEDSVNIWLKTESSYIESIKS